MSIFRKQLHLIQKTTSSHSIVIPIDAPEQTKRAAAYLQQKLNQASGVKLRIVPESSHPPRNPAIYLGKTTAARKAKLPLNQLKGWTYLKQVVGKNLFLAGQDGDVNIQDDWEKLGIDRPIRRHPGKTGTEAPEYLGTLKAVLSFLEEEAGFRYLMPGEQGVHIPRINQLSIPANLKVLKREHFLYLTGANPGDEHYAIANHFWGHPTPLFRSFGGHTHLYAVPRQKYAATNPEYFAFLGGVRSPEKNHLCISNREVHALLLKHMEEQLDKGYEWTELAHTDGYQGCQCRACAKIHSNPAERIWIVHTKLAAEMKRRRPGKKIVILAYAPTWTPPKTIKRFPDNVVVQLCSYSPTDLEAWDRVKVTKTAYIYNWGAHQVTGFGPKRTPRYAAEQVRNFIKHDIRGLFICMGFPNPGLEGPVYYVYGKLMGNPLLNHETLLQEYYELAFGRAKAPMKAFFTEMYDRLEIFSVFNRPNIKRGFSDVRNRGGQDGNEGDGGLPTLRLDPFDHPEDAYNHLFPAKLIVELQRNLETAKTLENDPAILSRLALIEREFTYVKNLATIFHFYGAYRLDPCRETFERMATEIERRHALLDEWFDSEGNYKPLENWPPVPATRARMEAGGIMQAVLSNPVNWNTRLLREKGVLPGVDVRRLTIPRRAGPIKLDGKVEDKAWESLSAVPLVEIGLGELKNATSFKACYDDDALYFALECELKGIEFLEVKAQGHDGKVHQAESVEILLDPFGLRERYYHLMFNPIRNSYAESRWGFIEDPLHPAYRGADWSWDGKWDYATEIDVKNQRWTAEVRIPFRSLEMEPPTPGTNWTMNIARSDHQLGKDKRMFGSPTLALWSPNLETRSYHSTAAFGIAEFR